MRGWAGVAVWLGACACGGATKGGAAPTTADEGAADGGSADGGTADGGSADGGAADGGSSDTGGHGAEGLRTGAHSLGHGGRLRTYWLHRPDGLGAGAPLVLALHGYGGDGAQMRDWSGLVELADEEGFVVAFPDGETDPWGNRYWEVGYSFSPGTVDDVGFLRALVAELVDGAGVDSARVFATGMSNGGDLSYRLACEADDLVRAVIPVAGCLMGIIAESCAPTRPVPLLEIHGTDDPITLWGGDPDGDDGWGVYLGAEASVGHFVDHYGHTDYAEEAVPDREADGRTARRRRWTGGPSGVEVQLLQVDGGGHDWPGAFGPHDVDAAAEVWAFAQAAP